ncbi:NAD(P)/FAD-dependent oxidoreductase [Haloechinothrix sp. LS1_15]|uniref:NAD(P)/FAD-dependent oxidoreductase n=1 Tax=Haloechinothrix sp. LS1_15 TaxID=2652248 RepID=UPI0029440EF5|nr:NAD(P)/FAD-dependent oxidoreductase [Haloechinothrix sp. LS1_15]MDV6013967.1 hypothetical protein [Haloechinothrix sp. LS1_15]
MTPAGSLDTEALIVGGGPAGASAAITLAAAGLAVTVVDAGRRSTGDAVVLSPPALGELDTLGVTGLLSLIPIRHGRFLIRDRATVAATPDAAAGVTERAALLDALLDVAAGHGAHLVNGTVTAIRTGNHGAVGTLTCPGDTVTITARTAVVATGRAPSELGLPHHDDRPGGAAITRRFHHPRRDDHFDVHLPITDLAGSTLLPAYGWVHPDPAGGIRIGLGIVDDRATGLIEDVFDGFVARVTGGSDAMPRGTRITGDLRHGFAPHRCGEGAVLLAGDTAGLVNPFTGEGISYALESGRLAAEAITAANREQEPAGAAEHYTRILAGRYVGQFEASRHAIRRYHLAWRTLDATAGDDTPFVVKARQAMLLPSGLRRRSPVQRHPRIDPIKPMLLACDEILLATVRDTWPFLARLVTSGEGVLGTEVRPARLMLHAARVGGRPVDCPTVAAAIELGVLAAVTGLSVRSTSPPAPDGIHWGNNVAILAADFLLARGAALVARSTTDLSWAFADWLEDLAAVRGETARGYADPHAFYERLFEFPCRIGGALGGSGVRHGRALREFGARFGRVIGHAEDGAALDGRPTRLESSVDTLIGTGVSAIERWWSAIRPGAAWPGVAQLDPGARRDLLAHGRARYREARQLALDALAPLPPCGARESLAGLVTVAAPASYASPGPSVRRE